MILQKLNICTSQNIATVLLSSIEGLLKFGSVEIVVLKKILKGIRFFEICCCNKEVERFPFD